MIKILVNWAVLAKICLVITLAVAMFLTISLVPRVDNAVQFVEIPVAYQTQRPFIPDSPSKIPVMMPADIPRQFLIEEADLCRRRDNVQVVSYVHSAIGRVAQRMATRRTWANSSAHGLNMIVVFMVGLAKDEKETKIIEEESSRYHDIVQGNYTDDYRLLSYKALSSLYWITRHCAHVPWTLHADDDLLVDTFLLQQLIHDLDDESEGTFTCNELRVPVLRKGKWAVSSKEYSNKRYPPYCQGTVWLLATRLVPTLLEASKEVNFLWVDDVYITGMLAQKAGITKTKVNTRSARKTLEKKDIGKTFAWFHAKEKLREKYWLDILNHYKGNATVGIIEAA